MTINVKHQGVNNYIYHIQQFGLNTFMAIKCRVYRSLACDLQYPF